VLTRLGIPGELLAELERRSELTKEPVEMVAQRLIASVLPEALAEAARDAFGHLAAKPDSSAALTDHGTPEKQGTQQPELLGASDDFSSRPPSVPSVDVSVRLSASTAHTKPDANGTSD
jgi:hypothetical protein